MKQFVFIYCIWLIKVVECKKVFFHPELQPLPGRLDPPGGQVLALHSSGHSDRPSDPAGQRPGERVGLLHSERQLWMCADPQQQLLCMLHTLFSVYAKC